jgi:predicted nucleic acid-binding protein
VAVLVDTGVFVSAADTDEPRHHDCTDLLREHRGELVVPAPVVAETAWLIEARLGPAAETRFLRLVTTRQVRVVDLSPADYERCVALITTYADLGLGLVDASVVTVAERLGITTVATLNHRDFRVVRPDHADAFTLIP